MYRAFLGKDSISFMRDSRSGPLIINLYDLKATCENYKGAGYSVVGLENYEDWGSKSGDVVVSKGFELSEKQRADGNTVRDLLATVTDVVECDWNKQMGSVTWSIMNFGERKGDLRMEETYPIIEAYNTNIDLVNGRWQPIIEGQKRVELGDVIDTLQCQYAIRMIQNAQLTNDGRGLYVVPPHESGQYYNVTILIPELDVAVVVSSRINPSEVEKVSLALMKSERFSDTVPEGCLNAICTDIKIIPLRVKATDE